MEADDCCSGETSEPDPSVDSVRTDSSDFLVSAFGPCAWYWPYEYSCTAGTTAVSVCLSVMTRSAKANRGRGEFHMPRALRSAFVQHKEGGGSPLAHRYPATPLLARKSAPQGAAPWAVAGGRRPGRGASGGPLTPRINRELGAVGEERTEPLRHVARCGPHPAAVPRMRRRGGVCSRAAMPVFRGCAASAPGRSRWRLLVAAAGMLSVVGVGSADENEGKNSCSVDTLRCVCNAADARRCLAIKRDFDTSGVVCKPFQNARANCLGVSQGNVRAPYCHWVPQTDHGGFKCELHACWLKMMNVLAACPGFWPNVTALDAGTWAASSAGACSVGCYAPFESFMHDARCQNWLSKAVLCDDPRQQPYTAGCQPKPQMRLDLNAFDSKCVETEKEADYWAIEWLILYAVIAGMLCGVAGYVFNRRRRKQEKIKRHESVDIAMLPSSSMEAEQGVNPVQDQNTPSTSGSANMVTMEME